MSPTSQSFFNLVQQFGLPLTIFILIVWSGMRGLWVYGYIYRQERNRADRFEQLALDLLQTVKKSVDAIPAARTPPE